MKRWISLSLLLAVALLGAPLLAEETAESVTLSGKLVCAKCTLQLEGFAECQDVLVVEGEGGEDELYFVAAAHEEHEGEPAAEVEHTCMGEKAVTIEGTLSEKDGGTWITPARVEEPGA
jgi:hypothetical protein